MKNIPVFDVGDTLMPSYRLQNDLVKEELRKQGAEDIPDFDINNFRIYTPSEVKEYLENNNIEKGDPERIIEKYKDRERRYLEDNNVFEVLRNISHDYGPIGFISDNSIEGKKWFEKQLISHNVQYEGLVVSEEVGVEKPEPKIFEKFLELRDERANRFTYFGNNLNRDIACQKVGMKFVLVDEFKIYGSTDQDLVTIDKLTYQKVEEVI